VLYRYIVKNKKTVIHVRERYETKSKSVVRYIKKAAGVIFIDKATFDPFFEYKLKKYAIINNPFDMTSLQNLSGRDAFEGIELKNTTVFSMIGQVNASKGILDVVRAFHNVDNQKIILFIAGNCSEVLRDSIAKACGDDPRIKVLGHRNSVLELYAVTDYLIRGELYQCIGRTMIEALFAGCAVLVPGMEPYQEFGECLELFTDKINFYPPGDFSALSSLIAACVGRKIKERKYYSNVAVHVQQLNSFLTEIAEL
jgi:glycosyltransferase involved in cell wall biosynthesis